MKPIKLIYLVVLFLLITSVGCQNNTDQETPGIDMPLSEMNNGINILVPEVMNNISNLPFTFTEINNTSDQEFRLNKQNGIFIYKYENNQWVPINNLMDYGYDVEVIIYSKESGLPSKDTIVIVPDASIEEENNLLRIVCIGEFVSPDGKTIQQAGAYRDFWLTPDRTVISIDEESL